MSEIVQGVLELLVCPRCHAQLTWAFESSELLCTSAECGLAFPVRQGIPILVEDEARKPGTGKPGV